MDRQRYITRAVKRLIQFTVLIAVLLIMLWITKLNDIPLKEMFASILGSNVALLLVMVGWSAVYPRFAYRTESVPRDLAPDREALNRVFDQWDYSPAGERDGKLIYRSQNDLRKFASMGEDAITVTQDSEKITLEGPRRYVVSVVYALQAGVDEEERQN